MEDIELIGDELAEGRQGVSLWKTKQQMDAAKELEEDRQLFRDTKKKHTESHIEKQIRNNIDE